MLAAVLVVLFAILLPVTILATWAHRTVANTDAYVATVGPIAASPEVQAAVSAEITNEIYAALNPQQTIASALPPKAATLAGPLSAGAKGYIRDAVSKVLASPKFQQLWVAANRFADTQLISVLKGGARRCRPPMATWCLTWSRCSTRRSRACRPRRPGCSARTSPCRPSPAAPSRPRTAGTRGGQARNRAALRCVTGQVLHGVFDVTMWFLIGGLIVLVVVLLAGPYRWAVATRAWGRRAAGSAGQLVSAAGGHASSDATVTWVRRHLDLLRIGGAVIAALAVLIFSVNWVTLLIIAVLLALYEFGLHRLRQTEPAA